MVCGGLTAWFVRTDCMVSGGLTAWLVEEHG